MGRVWRDEGACGIAIRIMDDSGELACSQRGCWHVIGRGETEIWETNGDGARTYRVGRRSGRGTEARKRSLGGRDARWPRVRQADPSGSLNLKRRLRGIPPRIIGGCRRMLLKSLLPHVRRRGRVAHCPVWAESIHRGEAMGEHVGRREAKWPQTGRSGRGEDITVNVTGQGRQGRWDRSSRIHT